MSKEERKAPELRFRSFHNDWEHRKLNTIVERVTRKNKNNESTLPLTISAQDGLVDQNTYFNKQVASKDMSNYYLLKKGDFAYNKSYSNGFPLGTVKRLDKYDQGALSSLYIVFRPKKVNTDFLSIYYDTNKWHREVMKLSAEGARNHGLLNIPVNSFFEKNIIIPIHEKEQLEIAKFLKRLEKIIALHRRKAIILKKIMKLYLVKLFTQDKKIFPELHFTNFSVAWEQHEFNNLFEKIKSYPLSRSVETSDDTGVRYIHYGDIHTKVADKVNNKSSIPNIKDNQYEALIEGDIVLADASEDYQGIAEPAVIIEETNFKIVAGLHTIALRPRSVDSLFMYYLIKSPLFRKHGYKTGTGMKVFGITATNVLKFSTSLPDIEEQYKIGRFLNQINQTILFHEKKINSLTELKKVYLRKMFL